MDQIFMIDLNIFSNKTLILHFSMLCKFENLNFLIIYRCQIVVSGIPTQLLYKPNHKPLSVIKEI